MTFGYRRLCRPTVGPIHIGLYTEPYSLYIPQHVYNTPAINQQGSSDDVINFKGVHGPTENLVNCILFFRICKGHNSPIRELF